MDFVPPWAIGVVVVIVTASIASVIMRMLRDKLGWTSAPTLTSPGEAAELRQSIEALQNRLAEVEERLDFTERLLATHREAERLGPPPG
jgi:hypothetical protein